MSKKLKNFEDSNIELYLCLRFVLNFQLSLEKQTLTVTVWVPAFHA